jgi:hypothetical protein
MSLAAWKGFIQLITNPFYWEKTTHGLHTPAAGDAPTPVRRAPASAPLPAAVGPRAGGPDTEPARTPVGAADTTGRG